MQSPSLQTIDTRIGNVRGPQGESPGITITDIAGGHRVTITDKEHQSGQSFDVMDGDVSTVADPYNSESTYAVGDYCIYGGNLYVCSTAITTAEAWTAAHWTATTIAGILGNIQTVLASVVSVT